MSDVEGAPVKLLLKIGGGILLCILVSSAIFLITHDHTPALIGAGVIGLIIGLTLDVY